jgi:hypothetical protein
MPRRTFCRKLNHYQITLGRRSAFSAKTVARPVVFHRTEMNVPVRMTDSTGHIFTAEARNLSVGGLGLQSVQPPVRAAEELTVSFMLPGSRQPIEVHGVVVWSQPNGMAGIKFIGVSDATAQLFRDWISHHRQRPPAEAAEFPPPEEKQDVAHYAAIS